MAVYLRVMASHIHMPRMCVFVCMCVCVYILYWLFQFEQGSRVVSGDLWSHLLVVGDINIHVMSALFLSSSAMVLLISFNL